MMMQLVKVSVVLCICAFQTRGLVTKDDLKKNEFLCLSCNSKNSAEHQRLTNCSNLLALFLSASLLLWKQVGNDSIFFSLQCHQSCMITLANVAPGEICGSFERWVD